MESVTHFNRISKDNSIITYFVNEVELLVLIPVASTVSISIKLNMHDFRSGGAVKMRKALMYTNAYNCRNRLQNGN